MNWDAISAVGEIIGAVAVVISLVYLAVQIRQNSKIVAANTFQSISATASDLAMRLAESPELSELMLAGFGDPKTLTPKQSMQMQLFLRASFRNYENYYYQHRLGYLNEDLWSGYEYQILDQESRAFMGEWWKVHQVAFGKGFVEYVNAGLEGHVPEISPWDRDELRGERSDS